MATRKYFEFLKNIKRKNDYYYLNIDTSIRASLEEIKEKREEAKEMLEELEKMKNKIREDYSLDTFEKKELIKELDDAILNCKETIKILNRAEFKAKEWIIRPENMCLARSESPFERDYRIKKFLGKKW